MLGARVVRVKLWTRDGRIVYSDEPRLIGARFPLDAEKLDVLRTGTTKASLSDLAGPENRYERGQGDLYEVYLPIRAPDGTPLLFETYQRRSAVASTGRRIWMPFAALLLGSLVVLWVVQVPLASRLDRRLRRTQAEREALLVRAVEASDDERRRIAAELHDGPVQDLAGISYSLSAAAQTESSSVARETLQHAAAGTRDSMRQLRSLLVDIHPPNLRASGLEAALADLLAPLQARGAEIELTVGPALALDEDAERTRLPGRRGGVAKRPAACRRAPGHGLRGAGRRGRAARGHRRRSRLRTRRPRAPARGGPRRPVAARGARGAYRRPARCTLGARRGHDLRYWNCRTHDPTADRRRPRRRAHGPRAPRHDVRGRRARRRGGKRAGGGRALPRVRARRRADGPRDAGARRHRCDPGNRCHPAGRGGRRADVLLGSRPDPAGPRRRRSGLPSEGRGAGGDREGTARRREGRGAARPARGTSAPERAQRRNSARRAAPSASRMSCAS